MSTVEGIEVQELGSGGALQPTDTSAVGAGGIVRLNAFDGLFLRAEHLNATQDYALALALALGTAGGAGVVEGFGVALKNGTLEVGAGLAIDPTGRPLPSRAKITLPLDKLQPDADTFWFIEAIYDSWPDGNEPVQGLLCDEPCAGGTTSQPYKVEGTRIQLTRASEPGLVGWRPEQKRSRLASRLFALEETAAGAWSRTPGKPGANLANRGWLPPPAQDVTERAVRLGILIPDADLEQWQVDVWAARRDHGASPPTRLWQWQLGMRPWDVYVAQILQFQDVLGYSSGVSFTATVLHQLEEIAANIPHERQTKARSAELVAGLRDFIASRDPAGRGLMAGQTSSLPMRGIDELPSAGFLPYQGSLEDAGRAMEQLLGTGVRIRVCTCRPADVAQAVQQAQHRDRIPLSNLDLPADVDILIPVTEDTGQPAFDWVAFAHREEITCGTSIAPAEADHVRVWLFEPVQNRDAEQAALEAILKGQIPKGAGDLGQLDYPRGTWAVPEGAVYTAIYGTVAAVPPDSSWLAVGLVTAEGRRPLGEVRAMLLALAFTPEGQPRIPRVFTALAADREEAIVLIRTTRR